MDNKKLKKIANTPHKALARGAHAVWRARPKKKPNGADAAVGKAALTVGAGATSAAMFGGAAALAVLKNLLVLNPLIEKMQKDFSKLQVKDNDSVKKFVKKHPKLMSYLAWYMMLASIYGGYRVYDSVANRDAAPRDKKEVVVKSKKRKLKNTDKFENFKLDPTADDETWQMMIDAVHPYIIAHLFSHEEFIDHIYMDNGRRGTETLGTGFTVKDAQHRRCAERVLGRPLKENENVTVQEARDISTAWMYEYIYPKMRSAFKVRIDARLFITLAVAAYNAGESQYTIAGNSGIPVRDAVNAGESIEVIMNKYINAFGKVRGTQWPGMPNKYSVLAMYALGKISEDTILDAIAGAPYSIEDSVAVYQKAHGLTGAKYENKRLTIYPSADKSVKPSGFFIPPNIEQMLLGPKYRVTKGTVQHPVREYMTDEEIATIRAGKLFVDDGIKPINKVDKKHQQSIDLNAQGLEMYESAEYGKAVKLFKQSIKKDAENYDAYGNLTIAYYKNGQYSDAVDLVCEMRENPDISSDIMSGAYYNAALSCRALGDNSTGDAALQYYREALDFLDSASALSGVQHKKLRQEIEKLIKSDKQAYNRATDKLQNLSVDKGKERNRFERGRKRVEKMSYAADSVAYNDLKNTYSA